MKFHQNYGIMTLLSISETLRPVKITQQLADNLNFSLS